ncbi:hypothetical protein APSETT445_007956 [Aspergillus pseudonomiae]
MVATTALRNVKDTGSPLRVRVWSLLTANVWAMGFSDLAMVIHSYAFYNGHLSETERRLSALDNPGSASIDAAVDRYPDPAPRRPPTQRHSSHSRSESIQELREDLATELTSPLGHVTYPQNLTLPNYVDFAFCPTLCYELEYPRSKERSWAEIGLKTCAVFGCIFLLTLTSEEFILPVLSEANTQLHLKQSAADKALILAETINMLMFPFMITFLLVFLVIFEYVLGAFAEITCFADRHFYSDWWNSCDWLEFSREWNIPVHHFLRRHVYFPSKARFSQSVAMFITFLVSSVAHELVMSCITKKLRGYGFVAMMLQLPLVAVQQSKYFRGKTTLRMCALYVLV